MVGWRRGAQGDAKMLRAFEHVPPLCFPKRWGGAGEGEDGGFDLRAHADLAPRRVTANAHVRLVFFLRCTPRIPCARVLGADGVRSKTVLFY